MTSAARRFVVAAAASFRGARACGLGMIMGGAVGEHEPELFRRRDGTRPGQVVADHCRHCGRGSVSRTEHGWVGSGSGIGHAPHCAVETGSTVRNVTRPGPKHRTLTLRSDTVVITPRDSVGVVDCPRQAPPQPALFSTQASTARTTWSTSAIVANPLQITAGIGADFGFAVLDEVHQNMPMHAQCAKGAPFPCT